jgi:hypothetical protein
MRRIEAIPENRLVTSRMSRAVAVDSRSSLLTAAANRMASWWPRPKTVTNAAIREVASSAGMSSRMAENLATSRVNMPREGPCTPSRAAIVPIEKMSPSLTPAVWEAKRLNSRPSWLSSAPSSPVDRWSRAIWLSASRAWSAILLTVSAPPIPAPAAPKRAKLEPISRDTDPTTAARGAVTARIGAAKARMTPEIAPPIARTRPSEFWPMARISIAPDRPWARIWEAAAVPCARIKAASAWLIAFMAWAKPEALGKMFLPIAAFIATVARVTFLIEIARPAIWVWTWAARLPNRPSAVVPAANWDASPPAPNALPAWMAKLLRATLARVSPLVYWSSTRTWRTAEPRGKLLKPPVDMDYLPAPALAWAINCSIRRWVSGRPSGSSSDRRAAKNRGNSRSSMAW